MNCWCQVDGTALAANVAALKGRLAAGSRLGIVVKSNAYGHGLDPCADLLMRAGVDWLVVNSAAEALALRDLGVSGPVYICGPVLSAEAEAVAAARARVVLYDEETARALGQAARAAGWVVPLHLKIETGTHRQGLDTAQALALAERVQGIEGVRIEGLTTHFADIEDSTDHRFAQGQMEALEQAVARFRQRGHAVPVVHAANSAATLLWPETHLDLVRVGIAAYGLWPSRETFATALQRSADRVEAVARLRPVLSWRAAVVQVKEVPAGAYVGYGRSFRATHRLRLAVLPVGYYEGYDRRLSNIAHVLVHGVRAPVRGRVCMNMMMVDVSDIPQVRVGSVATLLGRDGDEEVSAEMLAGWMGSIHYEAVARIHADLPRRLVNPSAEEGQNE